MFAIKYIRYNKKNKPETNIEYAETPDEAKTKIAKLLSISGYQKCLNKIPKNKYGVIEDINVFKLTPQTDLTDWGIDNKEEFEQVGIEGCKQYNAKYGLQ